jgi:hypothetical protein
MSGYALTPLAKADVFQVWAFIARDSPAPLQIVAILQGKRNARRILRQRP